MNHLKEYGIDRLLKEHLDSKTGRGDSAGSPEPDSSFTNDFEFDISFRGYNRRQVDEYLDAISEDYNRICEKCHALQKENEGLTAALAALGRMAEGGDSK